MAFMLREVQDEFNINRELKQMTLIRFATDFLYCGVMIFFPRSSFVVLGCAEYIEVVLSLSLLWLTSFMPVKATFLPNPILPFALTEDVIEHLESAMIH